MEQAKEEVGRTQHAFLFVIWPHDLKENRCVLYWVSFLWVVIQEVLASREGAGVLWSVEWCEVWNGVVLDLEYTVLVWRVYQALGVKRLFFLPPEGLSPVFGGQLTLNIA